MYNGARELRWAVKVELILTPFIAPLNPPNSLKSVYVARTEASPKDMVGAEGASPYDALYLSPPLCPPEVDVLSERSQNCGSDSDGVKRVQDSIFERDSRELNSITVNKFDAFLRLRFPELGEKYRVCGRSGFEFSCGSCGKTEFIPKSCGIRGCPSCGKYQYQRLYRRYGTALKGMPQGNLRKVELTGGHLPITKGDLNDWYKKACEVLDCFWGSWVAGLEVSPRGSVHLHAITSGSYVGQAELSRKALEVLGSPVVWISRPEKLPVRYLIKDVAKTPDFKSEDLRIRYFLATRGLRMFRTRGLLYGLGQDVKAGCHFCDDCGGVMHYIGEVESPLVGRTPPPLATWIEDMERAAGVAC